MPSAAFAQPTATLKADQQLFEDVKLDEMNGQLNRALDAVNTAIEAGGTATAYALRCEIYEDLRRFNDAKPDCAKALQLDPQSALAHELHGDLLYDIEDLQGALKEYDTYLKMSPTDGLGYWRRCDARRRLGDWPGAQSDCNKAYAAYPNDPNIRVSRGRIELQSKQFAAAYADFDASVNALPRNTIALYWRGYTALQMKRYDQAVADFTTGIQYGDDSPDTYTGRARAYLAQGKRALAKIDWEKGIALTRKYGNCKAADELAIEEAVLLKVHTIDFVPCV